MTGDATGGASETVTALISWAHQDPDWTPEQIVMRREQVLRLAATLRTQSIDADLDLFHGNVDWTRWGPQRVRDVDVVLVVVSRAWTEAWEGRGNLKRNIGAAAEADVLRSISTESRDALQGKCRLVILPSVDGQRAVIPDGMHGIARFQPNTIDAAGLEDLLRDLTGQPLYPKPPLGPVPVLPPALTELAPDSGLASFPASPAADSVMPPTASPPTPVETASVGHVGVQHGVHGAPDVGADHPAASGAGGEPSVEERRSQLQAQLAALPSPMPGEGPWLPWYREWERVMRELAALPAPTAPAGSADQMRPVPADDHAPAGSTAAAVHSRAGAPDESQPGQLGPSGELPWVGAGDVEIAWHGRRDSDPFYRSWGEYASVYVHLIAVPPRRITARLFAQASAAVPQLLRDHAAMDAAAGLDVTEADDVTTVRLQRPRAAAFNAFTAGGLGGVRLSASGAATAWAELPRDSLGAVIDPGPLAADIAACIEIAAAALIAAGVEAGQQVAIAAEITPVTLITDGTVNELGNRNNAFMRGATSRGPLATNAEESLPLGVHVDHSADVADLVASLLIRTWSKR